jgi:hypothetical protein
MNNRPRLADELADHILAKPEINETWELREKYLQDKQQMDDEEKQKRHLTAWNFKRLMQNRGMKVSDLASSGACGESYIRQILSCKVCFGTRAAKKWAKIFEVPFTEFYRTPKGIILDDLIDKIKKHPDLIKSVAAFVEVLLKTRR